MEYDCGIGIVVMLRCRRLRGWDGRLRGSGLIGTGICVIL